jgi:hypothetical protein
MLKKYLKSSIIVLFQLAALAVLAAILVPLLLKHTDNFNEGRAFFMHYKSLFLIIHGLFYVALYFFWPFLVFFMVNRGHGKLDEKQIAKALHGRIYLLGIFIVLELLQFLR